MFLSARGAFATALLCAASSATAEPLIGYLPSDREYTRASACSCTLYAGKPSPPFSQALFTTTPESARIVVEGIERELKHVRRRASGTQWVNTFSGNKVEAVLRSRQVAFRRGCGEHPDPPAHGSCFVSHLRVKVGPRFESRHGAQVCEC